MTYRKPACRDGNHTFPMDEATLSCPPEQRCLCGAYTWADMDRLLAEDAELERMWARPAAHHA